MPLFPTLLVKPGYRPQAEDTSIEADVFYFTALRQKSQLWRVERFIQFNQSTRRLCLAAINYQDAATSVRLEYLRRRFGAAWNKGGSGDATFAPIHTAVNVLGLEGEVVVADPIALARKIVTILESLSIAYYIGGSVASSLFGESRYTEDLDLIIELVPMKVQPLLAAFLEANFYISDLAVAEAVSGRGSSFNVIDHETLEKADLFVAQTTAFAQSKMQRRVQYPLPDGSKLWMTAPEDIVLQKLVWGRGRQSEKQWRDVLGVLKLQGDRLDFDYLWYWSVELGLAAALDQAFREAGL
jgi:hypothetical protein